MDGLNIEYLVVGEDEEIRDSCEYKHKDYGIEDCMIVRATDVFPKDGVVQTPIHGNACGYGDSTILGEAISTVLREKYPNATFDEEQSKQYNQEKVNSQVVFETKRSTVHFCVNGLVGSHMQGDFQNRNFIILEPLKYHTDESLQCMRVEDVYFNDDVKLSNEAVVMINQNMFQEISTDLDKLSQLKNFKIVVYKGNEQIAVRKELESLGYDSFVVNNNGYVNTGNPDLAAHAMWDMCGTYAEEHDISLERHFYSQSNNDDREKRQQQGEIIDKQHLQYLLDNTNIPDKLKSDIEASLAQGIERNEKLQQLSLEFVRLVGLETISQLTQQFNSEYISKLNQKSNDKVM